MPAGEDGLDRLFRVHQALLELLYRVSVSGTAADELFTGYFDHHLAYLYEVKDDQPLYSKSKEAWNRLVGPIVRNPFLQDPDAFIKNPDMRRHIFLDADNFSQYMLHPWTEEFSEINPL